MSWLIRGRVLQDWDSFCTIFSDSVADGSGVFHPDDEPLDEPERTQRLGDPLTPVHENHATRSDESFSQDVPDHGSPFSATSNMCSTTPTHSRSGGSSGSRRKRVDPGEGIRDVIVEYVQELKLMRMRPSLSN